MSANALKRQSIVPRVDGILRDIERLRIIAERGMSELAKNEESFALAQFYLRQALEGVFHIGEHILSRLNGGRATEYKEIAKKLGEHGIVDRAFAQTKLTMMAGYRNRLTHFYADITPEEMYRILKEDLGDFGVFLSAVKQVLERPEKLGLSIE